MYNDDITNHISKIILNFYPVINLTDDQFFDFCQINRELRIERRSKGEVFIMSPTGGGTSRRNSELVTALVNWAKQDKTGVVFDSSAGFILPDGSTLSPDAAWVKRTRLAKLTPEQKEKFIPLCPDFVIELRSYSDSLKELQNKMQKYIDNGTELGWLIDPKQKIVIIYRPDKDIEYLENPAEISGESLLPNFVLELNDIWDPGF